jgi:hypothetical protein
MLRRFRQQARLIALAPMVAVAMVVFATCVAAATATPAQRACCEAMNHDCGEMAMQSSCCTGAAQDHWRLGAAAKSSDQMVSAPLLVATVIGVDPPPLFPAGEAIRRSSSPSPPGVATYLFVSSFRI